MYAFNRDLDVLQASLDSFQELPIPTAYAADTQVAQVTGNYNGVVRVSDGLYNTPSLIFFSGGTFTPSLNPIDLTSTSTRLITNNGDNIPYIVGDTAQGTTTPTQSLQLVGSTATTLTGVTITDWNTQSGTLVTTLGLPADTLGVVYYGTKEYAKIQEGGVVAAGGGEGGGGGGGPITPA